MVVFVVYLTTLKTVMWTSPRASLGGLLLLLLFVLVLVTVINFDGRSSRRIPLITEIGTQYLTRNQAPLSSGLWKLRIRFRWLREILAAFFEVASGDRRRSVLVVRINLINCAGDCRFLPTGTILLSRRKLGTIALLKGGKALSLVGDRMLSTLAVVGLVLIPLLH